MAQVEHARTINSIGNANGNAHPGKTTHNDNDGPPAIAEALRALLADSFALYLKTKNFHWHVIGPHFHPYHLVFDEHAEELFASTDELAARLREMGGGPANSEIAALRRIRERGKPSIRAQDMLSELMGDNQAMEDTMRETRRLCERHKDAAGTQLLETLLGQTERRSRFLCEMHQEAEDGTL